MSSAIQSIMRERRSIRRYEDRPIPHQVLERILESATWAPSAHNRQPWRFAVAESSEMRRTLAAQMGDRLRRDLSADGLPAEVINADVERSYSRISSAPIVILVCLSVIDMDTYPDERRNRLEYTMAVQSTAMAVQNLLLAAHDEGLGACWMCAPLFCPEVAHAALTLPEDWQPQALITLGYPAVERTSTRAPLETKVVWR